jgi:hypothetical protein
LDGAIWRGWSRRHSTPSRRIPDVWIQESHAHGALYSPTAATILRQWLIDVGELMSGRQRAPPCERDVPSASTRWSTRALEIRPCGRPAVTSRARRIRRHGAERTKRARFDQTGGHPVQGEDRSPPGVFLLSRCYGARRVLLRGGGRSHLERHGDSACSIPDLRCPALLEASEGAVVVAGVEAATHARDARAEPSPLLTIQIQRFCSLPKDLTDRDDSTSVRGWPARRPDFRVDPDELERTSTCSQVVARAATACDVRFRRQPTSESCSSASASRVVARARACSCAQPRGHAADARAPE